jgi:hypothetical protein
MRGGTSPRRAGYVQVLASTKCDGFSGTRSQHRVVRYSSLVGADPRAHRKASAIERLRARVILGGNTGQASYMTPND